MFTSKVKFLVTVSLLFLGSMALFFVFRTATPFEGETIEVEQMVAEVPVEESTGVFQASEETTLVSAPPVGTFNGTAHFYGELHGDPQLIAFQLARWGYYYENHGMRHLLMELPFFSAAFLNVWMQADDDSILDAWLADIRGTAMDVSYTRDFLVAIKANYPETVFHGTDVGHQQGQGVRFLAHLRSEGLEGTEIYEQTLLNMAQGRRHRAEEGTHISRVTDKFDNIVEVLNSLPNENIMGAFFGIAHMSLGYYDGLIAPGQLTVAQRLVDQFGDQIQIRDITPYRVRPAAIMLDEVVGTPVRITVEGIVFDAKYYGTDGPLEFAIGRFHRLFFRLDDGYEHFSEHERNGDFLPHHENFLMPVGEDEVFLTLLRFMDGTELPLFYRTSQELFRGLPTTVGFAVDDPESVVIDWLD